MKNFFGLNVTKGMESKNIDGHAYVVSSLDSEGMAEIEKEMESSRQMKKKSGLPIYLSILKYIFAFAGLIIAGGIAKAEVPISEAYQNSPVLFWVGGASIVLWIAIYIFETVRRKKYVKSDDFKQRKEQTEDTIKKLKEKIGVPEDAVDMDVLVERYVVKNDVVKRKNCGPANYGNLQVYAYVQDEHLYLASYEHVWAIPLTAFTSMELSKKRTSFTFWNKEEKPNSPRYRQYNIKFNNMGCIFARFYTVEIKDSFKEFCLLIPEYEGEQFMRLTGIQVKDDVFEELNAKPKEQAQEIVEEQKNDQNQDEYFN